MNLFSRRKGREVLGFSCDVQMRSINNPVRRFAKLWVSAGIAFFP